MRVRIERIYSKAALSQGEVPATAEGTIAFFKNKRNKIIEDAIEKIIGKEPTLDDLRKVQLRTNVSQDSNTKLWYDDTYWADLIIDFHKKSVFGIKLQWIINPVEK